MTGIDAPTDRAFDRSPHVSPSRYLTHDIGPVGGTLKARPEDFIVEELPAYQPCGEGEHLYLFLEKRGLSTLVMVREIARHFGVRESAVGYAGLKDKRAITRQLVSVHLPGRAHDEFPAIEDDRFRVLWVDRHTNKLRRGHLEGNRFVIRLRDVEATAALPAMRVLNELARVGVPNRLGEQRFGALRCNHLVGRAIVLGDDEQVIRQLLFPDDVVFESTAEARELCAQAAWKEALALFSRSALAEHAVCRALARGSSPAKAVAAIPNHERQYFVSAFQSAVFNAVLDERLDAGSLDTLVEGDLAFKHENGAVFDVAAEDVSSAQTRERLGRIEISPSGPLWGASMKRAGGRVGAAEIDALARFGVTIDEIDAYSNRSRHNLSGARRPLRVPLTNHDVDGGMDEHGHYVRLAFELPRGAFATSVMQEVVKASNGDESSGARP